MVSLLRGGMNGSGWQCILDEAQCAVCCIKRKEDSTDGKFGV